MGRIFAPTKKEVTKKNINDIFTARDLIILTYIILKIKHSIHKVVVYFVCFCLIL